MVFTEVWFELNYSNYRIQAGGLASLTPCYTRSVHSIMQLHPLHVLSCCKYGADLAAKKRS